jgi:hypothetical protein
MKGLKYVSNNKITSDLVERGWLSRTAQNRDVGDRKKSFIKVVPDDPRGPEFESSVVEVIHAIFGPNEDGEQVCLRYEHVAIRYEDIDDRSGQRTRQIVEVWHNEEGSSSTNPCTELFDSLAK